MQVNYPAALVIHPDIGVQVNITFEVVLPANGFRCCK